VFITIAAVATLAFGQQFDTTVAVRTGMRLDVDNFGGGITVRTWTQNSVRIRADLSSRDRVQIETGLTALSVSASGRRGQPSAIDYEITVPAWMELNLHGTYTDVDVTGTTGAITAETMDGEIKVHGGSRQVSLKSVQGKITLEGAKGRIEVSTVNEDVIIRNVSGDITAETVSGNITLEGIESASVEVNTTSGDLEYSGTIKDGGHYSFATNNGDVRIGVPERSNATVTVSTFNGEFNACFPVTLQGGRTKHRFNFTMGTGSAHIEVESFNGDIKLCRPGQLQHDHEEDREDN
jgi:hypothetical protein